MENLTVQARFSELRRRFDAGTSEAPEADMAEIMSIQESTTDRALREEIDAWFKGEFGQFTIEELAALQEKLGESGAKDHVELRRQLQNAERELAKWEALKAQTVSEEELKASRITELTDSIASLTQMLAGDRTAFTLALVDNCINATHPAKGDRNALLAYKLDLEGKNAADIYHEITGLWGEGETPSRSCRRWITRARALLTDFVRLT